METRLENAYKNSLIFAKSHYENFPVVLFTIPKEIRKHIAIVYQFARQADDIADEGNFATETRLEKLNEYENDFNLSLNGTPKNDFWLALKNTIEKFSIEEKLFLDLISAFKQDVIKNRYETFEELLDYCSRSANPVGRILLKIFNVNNIEAITASDKICTALQLTNFYQDISIDILKNRIYLPKEKMKLFGVEEQQIKNKIADENFKRLLKTLLEESKIMFEEGKNILRYIPINFQLQMKMTILGGEKILEKISLIDYDVFNKRPKLSKKDFAIILLNGLMNNV
ncbi:MAG: squalene synthase HpnC [Ignavibacteriales bacterium]|nr:squalene synthase HpnC [Ignavibacteriales bacterium]